MTAMSVFVISNSIRFYREKKGLTQSELASLLGVSKNAISSYECGDYNPTLNHAVQLCVLLDVDFCKLFQVYDSERYLFRVCI